MGSQQTLNDLIVQNIKDHLEKLEELEQCNSEELEVYYTSRAIESFRHYMKQIMKPKFICPNSPLRNDHCITQNCSNCEYLRQQYPKVDFSELTTEDMEVELDWS